MGGRREEGRRSLFLFAIDKNIKMCYTLNKVNILIKGGVFMKVFCDFDNTLVMSDRTIIDMINKKYKINKTENNIHDWGYRSILENITKEEVESMYESDYFFDNVKFFENSKRILSNYDFSICTAGSKVNLEKKFIFMKKNFEKDFGFFGGNSNNKGNIDMKNCIQIDDRVDCLLSTNSKYKILFKNYNNYTWQTIPSNSEIYVANSWNDVENLIEYFRSDLIVN